MTFIDRVRIELDPLAFSTANTRRTPGTHLTDVVRSMLGAIGVKGPAANSSFGRADLDAFALQGFLWEDEMTETLLNRVRRSDGQAIGLPNYVRLPEIATDGQSAFFVEYDGAGNLTTPIPPEFIVMSPDGSVLTDEYDGVLQCFGLDLLECKRTSKAPPKWDADPQVRSDLLTKWLSANRPDWMWQTPCYLKGLSLALGREVSTVQHHVQFCVGDWCVKVTSDDDGRVIPLSPVPIYEQWTTKYSEQQVADKWDAVYGYARDKGMLNAAEAR